QHQRIVEVFLDVFPDGFNAFGTFIIEGYTSFPDQLGAVQEVVNHHGFEHIQFKMTGSTTKVDGNIVAENLGGYHGKGLTLGGVYLTRHDRRTGLVIGDENFTNAASWAGAQHSDIVTYFHQAGSNGLQGAVRFHDSVVCGKCFKFILSSNKWKSG